MRKLQNKTTNGVINGMAATGAYDDKKFEDNYDKIQWGTKKKVTNKSNTTAEDQRMREAVLKGM